MAQTRGEKNCNPGNIERNATLWQGMAADQSADSRFIVFINPGWGIRALAKILLTYNKQGLNTVRKIIDKWAPPVENDTGAYVNHVAEMVGVDEDTVIQVRDPETLELLTKGIIAHENGRIIYDDALIVSAIDMALS